MPFPPLSSNGTTKTSGLSASSVVNDLVAPLDPGFVAARDRLASRVAGTEHRLRTRLDAVRRRHDLTSRLLLTSQRDVVRAVRRGDAPSSSAYWETIAEPHAQPLTVAGLAVVEEELDELETALRRFRMSVVPMAKDPSINVEAADITDAITVLVLPLAEIGMDATPINELGESWQRRLRRAAVKSVAHELLLAETTDIEALIERAELKLLDQPPWLHGDRLLAAFEIAHAEIRRTLRQSIRTTSMVVADLAPRQLVHEH